MRHRSARLLLVLSATALWSSTGYAQSAPPGGALAPSASPARQPKPPRSPRTPLAIVGTVLAGLGGATLLGAGITWLVASSEAMSLDDECPNHTCFTGTRGGDAYETARDASRAADVLVGIGAPVTGVGVVLLLYASALGPRRAPVVAPLVTTGGGGATVGMRF